MSPNEFSHFSCYHHIENPDEILATGPRPDFFQFEIFCGIEKFRKLHLTGVLP